MSKSPNRNLFPRGRKSLRKLNNSMNPASMSTKSTKTNLNSSNPDANINGNKKETRKENTNLSDSEEECPHVNSTATSGHNSGSNNKTNENSSENPPPIVNETGQDKKAILFLVFFLITLLSALYNQVKPSEQPVPSDPEEIIISKLQEKFPKQPNETWEHFVIIINDILQLNPSHPAVFLFIYQDKPDEVNSLVPELAELASVKLNTKTTYINVDKSEFHRQESLNDYGYLIHKYEPQLIEKQVMVVKDLQNIPGKIAQAFHSMCDEITPLVEKVVYIFTLRVDSIQGRAEYIAEKSLLRLWNDLDFDILMPLITRVTSTVLKVVD